MRYFCFNKYKYLSLSPYLFYVGYKRFVFKRDKTALKFYDTVDRILYGTFPYSFCDSPLFNILGETFYFVYSMFAYGTYPHYCNCTYVEVSSSPLFIFWGDAFYDIYSMFTYITYCHYCNCTCGEGSRLSHNECTRSKFFHNNYSQTKTNQNLLTNLISTAGTKSSKLEIKNNSNNNIVTTTTATITREMQCSVSLWFYWLFCKQQQ